MSDAKIDTMVMITGREYEALRAEVTRLKAVEADYDDHEREMINLEEDNARLTAENEKLRAALWGIHAICNNGPFVWAKRIRAIARVTLRGRQPND